MSELPLGYERIAPATWVYLSSLLMLGLYFKFNRVWSVRNVDLILLVTLAPGLLLVSYGADQHAQAAHELAQVTKAAEIRLAQPADNGTGAAVEPDSSEQALTADSDDITDSTSSEAANSEPAEDPAIVEQEKQLRRAQSIERLGYVWLFATGTILLIRMLVDAMMVRRPLLDPNLTTGGLAFLGVSLFVFLMANVATGKSTEEDLQGVSQAVQLRHRQPSDEDDNKLVRHGPGYAVIHALISFPVVSQDDRDLPESTKISISKSIAILSHLAIVLGIVTIGHRHFENTKTGVGVAALYLMLPYTAMMTGRIEHVIPAALLVWAIVFYRRPMVAGIFLGLACGTVYYPLFLLPLWISFYWQRGLTRFLIGVVAMLLVLALSLIFVSQDFHAFLRNLQDMFGLFRPKMEGLEGIWGLGWDPVFRVSVLAAFVVLSSSFAVWPAQKNLGSLLSCSAAVMIATQFWHGFGGGLFMAWYLPLSLLTFFRPNLEDRIALTSLSDSWWLRRRRETRSHSDPLAA